MLGFSSIAETALAEIPVDAAPLVPSGGGWALGDIADPQFYDWWRKRAREERQKLEVVKTEMLAPDVEPKPLREETIAAVEAASSVKEIQSLDLLKYERNILKAAIADYERMVAEDEEEAALLLLMH